MSNFAYKTSAWAEVKVDIYAGECCQDHKPYIEAFVDGDRESDSLPQLLIDAKRWPPGTKIKIEVPCCPECGLDAEFKNESGNCECGFNWVEWVEEQYQ